MDVRCTACGEPWDAYHLLQDVIFEALPHVEAKAWEKLESQEAKLGPYYRSRFQQLGWEFGRSLVNVIRCPCCPKEAKPDLGKLEAKAAIEEVLGGDIDGIISAFEDFQL